MPETVGAFAIVPSNDLSAAIPFWERLGFVRTGGDSAYVIRLAGAAKCTSPKPGQALGRCQQNTIPLASSYEPRKSTPLLRGLMT